MKEERVAPDDPERCTRPIPSGQCNYRALPGQKVCRRHGGQLDVAERYESNLYRLNKARHRDRLNELSSHEKIKSLREEIGLCRILIEERFNSIKTDTDLMAASSALNSMFLTLERLVKTTHQMEQSLGELLARSTVMALGQHIVQILMEELKNVEGYEAIVDRTCDRLYTAIEHTTNIEKTEE